MKRAMNESGRKGIWTRATTGRMTITIGILLVVLGVALMYCARHEPSGEPVVPPARPAEAPAPVPTVERAEADVSPAAVERTRALAIDRDWEGLLDLLREGHAKSVCPVILEGIGSYDEEVRFHSNCLLIWVGDTARPWIPDILTRCDYRLSHRSAVQTFIALESIGPPRVEDITAIERLMVGPAGNRRISRRRPECHWRVECAHALARLGDRAAHTIPSFATLLNHSDLYANRMAARALVDMGPAGASGIPMILRHKGQRMTGGVYDIYDGIASFGERAVPYLIDALRQPDSDVCKVALFQICRSGKSAQKTVPALLDLYREPGKQFRRRILDALAATGTSDPEALRLIEREMVSGEPGYIRYSATMAFTALAGEEQTPRVLRRLLPMLNDKKKKWSAIRELGKIGPAAQEAVPVLAEFMLDDYMQLAMEAALAYWRITGDTAKTLSVMERFFDTPKWPLDRVAFRVLETMGPAAREAIGRIDEVIANEGARMVNLAAMARYRITGDPGPTVEALADVVDTCPSRQYRKEAAIALAEFGPEAKAAVPALVRALAWEPILHEGIHCIRAIRSILGPDSFPSDVLGHAVLPGKGKPWKLLKDPAIEERPGPAFPLEDAPPDDRFDVF